MNDLINQLHHWLILSQLPEIGFSRLEKLLFHFHSIENMCKATSAELRQLQLTEAQIQTLHKPDQRQIDHALNWQAQPNQYIISCHDPRYPTLLSEIASKPLILYVQGQLDLLSRPQLAMVGSRNPSHAGLELSVEFGYQLSKAGLIVTSGLALGVDAASHQGALAANAQTIAVLGSGLEKIYPKRNLPLAEKIIHSGCLVSEFPLDMAPVAHHFPRRNRIISGLSLGTLVVEAALKSGSLITARFALEQSRDVFAIPGSVRNPVAQGCLWLIQQGAKCVTSIDDILNELPIDLRPASPKYTLPQQSTLDWSDNPVLACIQHEVTSVDQICARSKLPAQSVTAVLLQLELEGVIKRQLGGYVKVS